MRYTFLMLMPHRINPMPGKIGQSGTFVTLRQNIYL
jgi:hypothetical protein